MFRRDKTSLSGRSHRLLKRCFQAPAPVRGWRDYGTGSGESVKPCSMWPCVGQSGHQAPHQVGAGLCWRWITPPGTDRSSGQHRTACPHCKPESSASQQQPAGRGPRGGPFAAISGGVLYGSRWAKASPSNPHQVKGAAKAQAGPTDQPQHGARWATNGPVYR